MGLKGLTLPEEMEVGFLHLRVAPRADRTTRRSKARVNRFPVPVQPFHGALGARQNDGQCLRSNLKGAALIGSILLGGFDNLVFARKKPDKMAGQSTRGPKWQNRSYMDALD